MNSENLSQLSDQQLADKIKAIKKNKMIDSALIGFTIGVVVYSAVKSGLGFFTFFPLILTLVIIRNSRNNKILENEIEKELKQRKG